MSEVVFTDLENYTPKLHLPRFPYSTFRLFFLQEKGPAPANSFPELRKRIEEAEGSEKVRGGIMLDGIGKGGEGH